MARADMAKFEPLTEAKVTKPGEIPGVTSALKDGERAFTIKVDVSTGVGGFLRPGDNVDVYWTGAIGKRRITKLIKSAVRIIAIDQSINPDIGTARIARTVTVAVTPEEVAALQQAQSAGRLSLSLVGAGSDSVSSDTPTPNVEVDLKDVLGIQEQVVQAEQPKKVCTIKSRHGTEIVTTEIPCTDGNVGQ
jgi:pilus assembly protein CpaB